MTDDPRRLVLVVDTDQRFVDDARPLLSAHRVLAARNLEEAREIVLGGRVDLVLLGPAFGSDVAITQARSLLAADPSVQIALVADVVTNRLLKAALKAGFADVLRCPLQDAELTEVLSELDPLAAGATEIAFVVEPMIPVAPAPPVSSIPATPEILTEAAAPADPMASGAVPPVPAAPTPSPEPISVSIPPEVSFVAEAAVPHSTEDAGARARDPLTTSHVTPPPEAPAAPVEPAAIDVDPLPLSDSPPVWPPQAGEGSEYLEPIPPAIEPMVRDAPAPDIPEPAVAEWQGGEVPAAEYEAPASLPPAFGYSDSSLAPDGDSDLLDRVLPPGPAAPPPVDHPAAQPSDEPIPRADPIPRSGPGRVIAITAGKGGSGKTITATNLAIAIGLRSDPARVAIVDADLQFGDVALLLQIDPVRTLDDVVGRLDVMSDEHLEAVLLRHESGIRVLPAPLLPVRAGEISAKSVVEVVNRLRSIFDTVLVDTGPVFDDSLITLLEHADQVITVVDMDLPSVKNSKVALDGLRRVGFDMERIRLVVNRVNSKARLDLVELERSLGLRIGGSIPSDRLIPQSVNEGIPVLALSPRSKVARAFHALAEALDPTADRDRITAQ